jgi:GNAT superfamily N-acetyltransferase
MLTLRELTEEEFPVILPYGQAFFDEYKDFIDDADFNPTHFLESAQHLYLWSELTVFGLWDQEKFVGGLAATIQESVFSKTRIGREIFFYVDPAYRRGMNAKRLIDAYRAWGVANNLRYCYMIHLHKGPLEEKLARLYTLCGFQKIETAYRLDLKESPCRHSPQLQ